MPKCNRDTGFTKVELLVVVGVIIIFAVLAGAFVSSKKRTYSRTNCIANLKEIGVAENMFQNDHNGNSPWSLSSVKGGTFQYHTSGEQTFRHFQVQSNYIIATRLLICPQDNRQTAANWENLVNSNLSYFVGLDSAPNLPMSIIAGDRNITADSSVILQATSSAPPSWISSVGLHGNKGHLVFGDGHVEELDSTGLANAIQRTGIFTNHFAVP